VDFSKWFVYFADERCVPLDHDDSNYKACKAALFDYVRHFAPDPRATSSSR
jgi:6-phosphogluconolactonase